MTKAAWQACEKCRGNCATLGSATRSGNKLKRDRGVKKIPTQTKQAKSESCRQKEFKAAGSKLKNNYGAKRRDTNVK